MKKVFCLVVIVAAVTWSCNKSDDGISIQDETVMSGSTSDEIIPGQYIVQLKTGTGPAKSAGLSYENARRAMSEQVQKILSYSAIPAREPLFVYTASIEGFTIKLSDTEAEILKKNDAVLRITHDAIITLGKPNPSPNPVSTQIIPWGITRVGGVEKYSGTNRVWIIDTGIDLDHPDLNVGKEFGATFVKTRTPDDDNGHGTHVSGIVAALNNNIGVIGVAPGALVIPVKVLDRSGSGTLSGVIAGVDFVAANADEEDVANMSLGGGANESLDDAVIRLAETKVYVSLSAGNSHWDAGSFSPGRVDAPNVWTVSAFAEGDIFASFSNYGNPPIDLSAPGVDILSTFKGGKYATMSGTSMAAPHVCGLLLLTNGNPGSDGFVENDTDGNPDPIAHY